MSGFLFEQIIFGPIRSRRLGISLGVNLLPLNIKHCSFNCLYCECGWTGPSSEECLTWPSRKEIMEKLQEKLQSMASKKAMLSTITFAGNGEPTLHPEFPGIIDDTISLRDSLYPAARISVLSNASTAGDAGIAAALRKVEMNILKLDAGTEETFRMINNPHVPISLKQVLRNLEQFRGQMIIQALFVRGTINGLPFDNTSDTEVEEWLGHIERLRPASVMIYPIARATPTEDVQKVEPEKLAEIARKVEALGIPAEVYH
jgi:wyosine [tRNA(Phe)-imidazoG37] synthetase (radical SAM superfamily)